MKQLFSLIAAGAVLLAGTAVYAGGACCPAKGDRAAKGKADKVACTEFLSQLKLSDEQKAKIADLKAECEKNGGCSAENHARFIKGLKQVLTPEQVAECIAACEKAGKGPCPMSKSASKI